MEKYQKKDYNDSNALKEKKHFSLTFTLKDYKDLKVK